MAVRREQAVQRRLEELLDALEDCKQERPDPRLPREDALACLEAAYTSRLLDLKARELKNEGAGYYTISSAGHEANAVLGRQLRDTDPCLLHYRSGALVAARAQQVPGESFLYDTLLSFVASAEDPVSGGRHKVWGSRRLWIPPQTSTIASHLPKAVGIAFALERAAHLELPNRVPEDAVVLASFGDASVNHASATTAFNGACWAAHQRVPVPILFVCENNGLGISVHTPKGWIRSQFEPREDIDYFEVDGNHLPELWSVTKRAIETCRATRRPCFLEIGVVRLLGHAGSDVESQYKDESWIAANESRDPLLAWSRWVCGQGFATAGELRDLYRGIRDRIDRVAPRAVARPKLESAEVITEDLAFPVPERVAVEAARTPDPQARAACWDGRLPEDDRPRHMAMLLSRALRDLMLLYPEMIVFGEDVAKKGGVYHVTAGLYEAFGVGRVFNTLLDETVVLAIAIGAAQIGLLPVPEIQYLAYLHNAEDQLRGEACSQRFFSRGQFDNPMVVRIASFAYQKGFGGHFHNDNSIGVLRDIPGLVIAAPSRGDDAVRMLRTCIAAAKAERAVVAFLEPIALYMTKDLYEKGDGLWSFTYPEPGQHADFGAARHYEPEEPAAGARLLVATYGNGVPMALRARRRVPGAAVHVMDLCWLAPLPLADFLRHVAASDGVVVLDECRKSGGGVAEALLAAMAEDPTTRGTAVRRVTALDTYIPLGGAADLVLPDEERVVAALEAVRAELERA